MFREIEVFTNLTERKKAIIKKVLTSYRKTARKEVLAIQMEKFVHNLNSERYRCLRGKVQGLLARMPATVPKSEA